MPGPHKGPSVTYAPGIVGERPEAAMALGVAVSSWGYIENDIEWLYAFLMARWSEKMPAGTFMPAHPVAILTFQTLQTQNQRLSLLEALAKWALPADKAKEVADVIPSIRQRAKERNTIAHGLWGISDQRPKDLILVRRFDTNLVYSAVDFGQVTERIADLHMTMQRLTAALRDYVAEHGWREPEPHEQNDGMILAMDQ